MEKNRAPNGLLLDYAMEFADLNSYNGTLTDSNKVNAGLLRDMYATITIRAENSLSINPYCVFNNKYFVQ